MAEVLVVSDGPQDVVHYGERVISHDVQPELLATVQVEQIVINTTTSEVLDGTHAVTLLEVSSQGPPGPTLFTDVAQIWVTDINTQLSALTLATLDIDNPHDFSTFYQLST